MQVGIVFPQYELGTDPAVLRDYAQQAEDLGYSHLLAYDHVLGADRSRATRSVPGPYGVDEVFHEPLTLFAHLAGVTGRIGFVTGVLVLPQRQAVLVAKQAAEVAVLSGGRLRLGVGTGWNAVEYEALGAPFGTRGRRLDEQVAVMRALWDRPVVDLDGEHHRIEGAGLRPRPATPIPVWFGGSSTPAFERAARIGDGFLLSRRGGRRAGEPPTEPIERSVAAAEQLRSRVAARGRDVSAFGVEGRTNVADGPSRWGEELTIFRDAGFDHVAVNMLDSGLDGPDAHLRAMAMYAEEIGSVMSWT